MTWNDHEPLKKGFLVNYSQFLDAALISTLSQPKTPKPIVTKFKRRDCVVDAYNKNWAQSAQGFLLPI